MPLLAGLLLLLVGCAPTKLLAPGQNMLSDIDLKGVDQADAEGIALLYQQKPVSNFPLPKLAIYQLGTHFYDSAKIRQKVIDDTTKYNRLIREARPDSVQMGKLLQKRERHVTRHRQALEKGNAIMRLGEPPLVYDSALTRVTVAQIATYLKAKGFFRSQVRATDTVRDRRATVTYYVTERAPFRYAQLTYSIPDSAVAQRVRAARGNSLLRVGDQYDEEIIGQERSRLERLLKNDGYFDFREQYITLEADTSFVPTNVRLRTLIADPAPGRRHRLFTVARVNFVTDAGLVRFGVKRDTLVRDSVYYLAYEHHISTKILDNKLEVRPDQPYNLDNTLLTQRQLGNLDMFRFNTVTYRRLPQDTAAAAADSTRGRLLAVVNAAPAKKYQETTEFGGTYVSELVGPFANVRLKERNVFGGAEVLELSLRAGFEGQYQIVNSTDQPSSNKLNPQLTTLLGGSLNLSFPQFLIPFRTNRYLTRYNPRTRINASYTYVKRPQYTRTNLELTYDYLWQRTPYHQYVLTPIDLSLVNTPFVNTVFRDTLISLSRKGFPLIQSFTTQLVPSVNATSLYNSNDFNETRDARYLRVFAEVGGLARGLYRQVIGSRLNIYNFGKFTADYRRYHKLGPATYFVYRFNVGIARALTQSTYNAYDTTGTGGGGLARQRGFTIPYDKYLFAGGSASVRAWAPRRLGPGSFTTVNADGSQNISQEQPGELLLEGSVEYRFPLYGFINGAVFTDYGNVWTLHADPRPGAEFAFNRFYQEFAVGSGFGLRLDFTFLIMRLDVATKVYDPTAPGSRWRIKSFGFGQRQTAFNLGIGYPF